MIDLKSTGAPLRLSGEQRRILLQVIEDGPVPYLDGIVRWRLRDLVSFVHAEFGVTIDESTLGRNSRAMGYRKLSTRPVIMLKPLRPAERSKKFPTQVEEIRDLLPTGTSIETWFQDEARIGRKTKITRRWAKRGTRPSAPKDQRTRSAWIYGAICPEKGVGAALVLPYCNTHSMNLHLQEISAIIAPEGHTIVIVDQAGWHFPKALQIPNNITLLRLPPRSPELNPVENIWQFMRDNWLSNKIFTPYNDIVDHYCFAWNQLVDQPWRIMSIGIREWANQ